MTLFVDASALITGEDGAGALADRLRPSPVCLCSALSVWEVVAGLSRSFCGELATNDLDEIRIRNVAIPASANTPAT